jgi:dCTP deaminase
MILTGSEIHKQVSNGRITIDPYDPAHLNPNSYNFHLGKKLALYKDHILDAKQDNPSYTIEIPDDGYVLQPERLYLGHIEEYMGSDYYVPILRGRSSIGRLGLFVNITADLVDLGSYGQWTLQFHAVQPVRVYPGMGIGQITWWCTQGERQLYDGKYQNARGPRTSESYKDFV